jgi:hypothetical protein
VPLKLSPYLSRPEHVVTCAIKECPKMGLRADVCSNCREYHCPEHLKKTDPGHGDGFRIHRLNRSNKLGPRVLHPLWQFADSIAPGSRWRRQCS